jgi:hypothetical protein
MKHWDAMVLMSGKCMISRTGNTLLFNYEDARPEGYLGECKKERQRLVHEIL